MSPIFPISKITVKEGLQHKIILASILSASLLMIASLLISGFFMRDISKIILDFCLSITNIAGLTIPLLLAITLLAGDIERKTIVTILARNISRNQYLVGKFLGIELLAGLVMTFFLLATYATVFLGQQLYGENYFASFSPIAVAASMIMSFMAISILNAIVVLWCTITTTSLLATLLTLATYITGHIIDDVVRFVESPPPGIEIASSIVKAMQIVQYLFPNLAAFDYKLSAAHGILVPISEFSFLIAYAITYIAAVMLLSSLIFQRRDLC